MTLRLYQVAVRHPGLNAYRVISGTDWYAVNMKARVQYEQWDVEYRARQAEAARKALPAPNREREAADRRERNLRKCRRWATDQTAEARRAIEEVRSTLPRARAVDSAIDWESLVDRSEFSKPKPSAPRVEPPHDVPSPGEPPDPNDPRYQPNVGVFGRLSASTRDARVAEANARLEEDRSRWAAAVNAARSARADAEARYDEAVRRAREGAGAKIAAWEEERSAFLAERAARNAELADRRRRYEARAPEAVVAVCHMVLARSEYPDGWPREVVVEYDPETRTAIVDGTLPPPGLMPDVREVTYDERTGRFAALRLTQFERSELHESVLYAIPLRVAHELFEADRADAIRAVAYNGWIHARDTGATHDRCVVSLVVERETFSRLDLAAVAPKDAFRALGGVGWSEHYNLDAVDPVVASEQSRGGDAPAPRATASMYGGLGLDEMAIEDFELLTRELVALEIATEGEQVSMARVDGGVDAIVLSPARRVRVVVHARRSRGGCSIASVRELCDARDRERAEEAVFIATEEADPEERELAASFRLALVDGPRLLNLLARHSGKLGLDPRGTRPIGASTGDLDVAG